MPESPERTALYRLYGADDRLLYIGITNNLEHRWKAHATKSWWWTKVASKSIEWFDDRQSARSVERVEIQTLNPPHNSDWNTWKIRAGIEAEKRRQREAAIQADLEVNPPGGSRPVCTTPTNKNGRTGATVRPM